MLRVVVWKVKAGPVEVRGTEESGRCAARLDTQREGGSMWLVTGYEFEWPATTSIPGVLGHVGTLGWFGAGRFGTKRDKTDQQFVLRFYNWRNQQNHYKARRYEDPLAETRCGPPYTSQWHSFIGIFSLLKLISLVAD